MTATTAVTLPKAPPFLSLRSKRFRVLLMLAFHMFCQGLMKTDMSMAMVCMVNTTAVKEVGQTGEIVKHISFESKTCGKITEETLDTQLHYDGTFVWTSEEQSQIFAAFFWGGLLSVIMCTWLSDRFGPSNVLLVAAAVNVVGSLMTPTAANMGSIWLIVVRFIMGMGQGIQYPLGATVAAAWFPIEEKSSASAIYTNGNQMSYVIAMLFSSQICQLKGIGGWKAIFIIYGILGAVMCCLWWWIVTDGPLDSKDITESELQHILGNKRKKVTPPPTPWLKMMASPVVIALFVCVIAQALAMITLTTYLPTYFKHVLQMDLTSNGFWSAFPFIVQTIMKFIVGGVADYIKKKYPKKKDLVTKCSNSLACFGASLCLMAVSFVSCGYTWIAIALVAIGTGCLSGFVGGYFTSLLSVAPLHTAALNSILRIAGQLASIAVPYLVGFLTVNQTAGEWLIVFSVISAVLMSSGVLFIIFGTVEPLSWSVVPQTTEDSVKIEKTAV